MFSGIIREALKEDLQKKIGHHDLFEWIEETATSLSAYGRTYGGKTQFTSKLLERRHVSEVQLLPKMLRGESGRLVVTGTGYIIQVKAQLTSGVKRYVIGHELGHTLWVLPPGLEPLSDFQIGAFDTDIEFLCDWFSSAILLPDEIIKKKGQVQDCVNAYQKLDIIWTNIVEWAEEFDIPLRVAAARVLSKAFDGPWQAACLKLSPFEQPSLFQDSVWYVSWRLRSEPASKNWKSGAVRSFPVADRKARVRYHSAKFPDVGGRERAYAEEIEIEPETLSKVFDQRKWSGEGVRGHRAIAIRLKEKILAFSWGLIDE